MTSYKFKRGQKVILGIDKERIRQLEYNNGCSWGRSEYTLPCIIEDIDKSVSDETWYKISEGNWWPEEALILYNPIRYKQGAEDD